MREVIAEAERSVAPAGSEISGDWIDVRPPSTSLAPPSRLT